jgi:hypothetical protein
VKRNRVASALAEAVKRLACAEANNYNACAKAQAYSEVMVCTDGSAEQAQPAEPNRAVRVLALCDEVADSLYGPAIRERRGAVDLVLTCGDLPTAYIDFVASMLDAPVYGIRGNHDPPPDDETAADGMVAVDSRVVLEQGLLIGGFDGSLRYNTGDYQYTETEMRCKVARMVPALMANKVRYGRYLDVLLTHAPPRGIHDQADLAHRGFGVYRWFLETFRPRYHLHGHVHRYNRQLPAHTVFGATEVVNVFPYKTLAIAPAR